MEDSLKSFVDLTLSCIGDVTAAPLESQFTHEEQRQEIENLAVLISNASTKLAILCKPPAQVTESKQILEELTRTVLALTTVSRGVSSDASGNTYLRAVQQTTKSILHGVAELANSFRRNQEDLESDHQIYLKPTGTIWLAKDIIQKMPKNNTEAVLARYEVGTTMASDALEEAEALLKKLERRLNGEADAIDGDEMGWDEDWDDDDEDFEDGPRPTKERKPVTEAQVHMTKECISLLKMAKMLLQKVSLRSVKPANVAEPGAISWLDGLAVSMEQVTENIDELCSHLDVLEDDEEGTVAQETAAHLNEAMFRLVDQVKGSLEASHIPWYEQFVEKAKSIQSKIRK